MVVFDAVADAAMTQTLAEALQSAALESIGAAFLLDLSSLRYGECRSYRNIYPASLIKMPIMAEAFHQFEAGVLQPDRSVVISQANQTMTAEETPLKQSYVATVAEMTELMITRSDNVATNQLMDVLGRKAVTAYMHELGLPTFLLGRKLSGSDPLIEDPEAIGRNRFPPAEAGRLLALIASDLIPGASAQRGMLACCVDNDKLVPGLRKGDVFMHKTGQTSTEDHDAGILDTAEGRRYVVVLYTTPQPNANESLTSHIDGQITEFMRALRAAL
ncbi:MAG: class A beta-lactamase-related serine hydrolase [Candidatus Eremiobacteraeota bacterium]|nr:class A beta-lactamase-related serine hydrolase [Candidatus Eremiobacteraeota bacterium]